jgi:hypothetical protein
MMDRRKFLVVTAGIGAAGIGAAGLAVRKKCLVGTAGIGAAGLAVSETAQAACASGTEAQMIVLQGLKATPALRLTYPSGAPADAGYPTVVDETIPPGQLGRYSTI